MTLRLYRAPTALVPRLNRAALYPPYPLIDKRTQTHPARPNTRAGAFQIAAKGSGGELERTRSLGQKAQRMHLEPDDIVPKALHRPVGWDMRHHFMAEKTMDLYDLALPRDRELVRQLAIVYVTQGLTCPPGWELKKVIGGPAGDSLEDFE